MRYPTLSYLVKKTNYDAKISDIESKYFSTSGFYKFTNNILDAKIKKLKFAFEFNISGFINNSDLYKKGLKQSKMK